MTDTTLLETGWSEALEAIGTALDVEASARSSGALKRARAVRDGAGLLRLALAYGGCGRCGRPPPGRGRGGSRTSRRWRSRAGSRRLRAGWARSPPLLAAGVPAGDTVG